MNKKWNMLPPDRVRVTDPYYIEAQERTLANVLVLDTDRLLAGFRETAGRIAGMDAAARKDLMKGKSRYTGGWEDSLIGGHTTGHILTALAQAVANPAIGDGQRAEAQRMLRALLKGLAECQELVRGTAYEGFLFAAVMPTAAFEQDPALQFDHVEHGRTDIFRESWVPWYTLHKIIVGLNAAWNLAGEEDALTVCNALAEWICRRTESWSEETNRTVLSIEYGGINDCLYELSRINRTLRSAGDTRAADPDRILAAAHRFDELPLYRKISEAPAGALDGRHANTTIPKFLGAISRYETLPGETEYLRYAADFWALVTGHHSYATGGNSEDEHFGADDVLDAERTNVNNETCNTHNMIKLARRLFAATGEVRYANYAAGTLLNAIMASQNHETGCTMYFQPMATGYHKVFSTVDHSFWCCTGTGYENFTKLQEGICYEAEDAVAVCLYLASELLTAEGTALSMTGDLTRNDVMRIVIGDQAWDRDLWLRIPDWTSGEITVTLNGAACSPQRQGGFLVIPKTDLAPGTQLEIRLPMGIRVSRLPDAPHSCAFFYGPFLLSAKLGTSKIRVGTHGVQVSVSEGRAVESDTLTITDGSDTETFLSEIGRHLVRTGETPEFELRNVDRPLTFVPHYDQYKECYGIYWALKEKHGD